MASTMYEVDLSLVSLNWIPALKKPWMDCVFMLIPVSTRNLVGVPFTWVVGNFVVGADVSLTEKMLIIIRIRHSYFFTSLSKTIQVWHSYFFTPPFQRLYSYDTLTSLPLPLKDYIGMTLLFLHLSLSKLYRYETPTSSLLPLIDYTGMTLLLHPLS